MSEIEVLAINRERGQIITTDDQIVNIVGWHNDEQEAECEPADASFVTFKLPNGKWSYAILSDFNFNDKAH